MWCMLLFVCILGESNTQEISELTSWRIADNYWLHLANITGVDHFCLPQGIPANRLISTCLIPVCRQPGQIQDSTQYHSAVFDQLHLTYADSANWGKTSYELPAAEFTLRTPVVAGTNATCAKMVNCKAKCQVIPGPPIPCQEVQEISYYQGHVLLPQGWFWTCGSRTWSYIPANLSDSQPCCLSRLVSVLPPWPKKPKRKIRETTLDESCNDKLHLWSDKEKLALTLSLLGVAGLTLEDGLEINRLACALVKSINATSKALSLLNKELQELRGAVLENQAGIDYLFLLHHMGCEMHERLYYFNLTDNSNAIEMQINTLHKIVKNMTTHSDGWWNWLTSWLP